MIVLSAKKLALIVIVCIDVDMDGIFRTFLYNFFAFDILAIVMCGLKDLESPLNPAHSSSCLIRIDNFSTSRMC